jgi:peptidoglycan/LPS O-acetylase OafA/YrhL
MMPTPNPRSGGHLHISGLDGLRGVAALAVLAHHVGIVRNQAGLFSHAYLAVDFFFLLSGFVMGLAYERRMTEGLSIASFMRLRLGRLYPMILLGAVLGFVVAGFRGYDLALWVALGAQLTFVPFAISRDDAYPLNNVQWSLFFEIFINAIHASFHRWLSVKRLAAVVVISGIALIFTDIHFGSLAIGYNWANFWGGVPRVVFSYSVGLLIYGVLRSQRPRIIQIPYLGVVIMLGALLAIPAIPWLRDSVFVIAIFPPLLLIALASTTPPRLTNVVRWAGAISYPLYAIHVPLLREAVLLVPKNASAAIHVAYWAVTVGLIVAFSWAAEYGYDTPIRLCLRQRAGGERE